jgi:5-(carboxyamino)imidazole ribonucleotide mutase
MTKTVGIIMGSDSDLEVMQEAAKVLSAFQVDYEMTGIKVIIAGAGGAAHLPGMIASLTTLPVIGVPVKLKTLEGMDSLLSIVQMPGGVPVATVAINNAKNAGLLAVQILATHDSNLADAMQVYKDNMKEEVLEKAQNVERTQLK